MQRLFSAFPGGAPGIGLLLLRVSLAAVLIGSCLPGQTSDPIGTQSLAALISGILLLAGVWTPVSCSISTLNEIWVAFRLDPSAITPVWMHIFLAALSVSVAMLGPGAWSIDARLFGRKRFDLDRIRRRNPSL